MSELWLLPPAAFELPPGVAHLWRASLDRPAEVRSPLAALLSPEEQARAARFHFEHGRHHYEVGRGLLRWLLGQYLHLPPQEVAFDYGEHGKPALLNDPTLEFNVSQR
jgi:4'-phosphopantetheinyl transferase